MSAGAVQSAGKGSSPERRAALTALAATTAAIVQVAGGDEAVEAAFVRSLARMEFQAVVATGAAGSGAARTCRDVAASALRQGSCTSGVPDDSATSVEVAEATRGADFDFFFVFADDHFPDRHAAASGFFLCATDGAGRVPRVASQSARSRLRLPFRALFLSSFRSPQTERAA